MTHSAGTPPSSRPDSRRAKRFQVTQAATITQAGHPDIECDIHDFCQGGLFLKFRDSDAAIATLKQRTDSSVDIHFTTSLEQGGQSFRFSARIKRMSMPGVGVTFDRQPIEALRALQKMRMAEHRKKFTALLPNDATRQLHAATTTLLHEILDLSFEQTMRALGDKLGAASMYARGISEHSGLLGAMTEFERHAVATRSRLIQRVDEALQHARPAQAQPGDSTIGAELALVDEDAFEDWLAASGEANKLEETFQESLLEIEPRVGHLLGLSCDRRNNPVGPTVICHAYRAAIADVPVIRRARHVAYAALGEALADQLALLYAELLAILPVPPVEPSQQPVAQSAPPTNDDRHATAEDGEADLPDTAPTAPRPAAAKSALGQLTSSLLDFFRGGSTAGKSSRRMPETGGAAGAPGGDHAPVTQDATAAVTGARGTQPMFDTIGVARSPVLQRLSVAGALPSLAAPGTQRLVDLFGALFDTMHAERSIGEGVRPLFQQMEANLLKLAMDDPQFLASPEHPAHKVLNTLDRISMAAGDDGRISDTRLLRLMRRWTDRINTEADKNPGVFEEARLQLEGVVKPLLNERAARVFRLQEMCEGRQSAEVAKQRILKNLLDRLDNREVPNAVIELLNGGWRNVLLIAEMRHGVDSEAARDAWHVLEKLCIWLDPDRIDTLTTSEIQTLLQQIDHALTQVSADKSAQDRIIDQLAAALFDENKTQHRHTPVAARLNDSASEPLSEAQDTLVERLRVGDWLQFDTLEAPLNLIWIGDQPHVYVFANYRGIKKLDLKRADFLQMLETGTARWTEDLELPLMDRSYSAMIQKMQRDLMWQSSHDPATGLPNRKSFFRTIRRDWLRNFDDKAGYALGVVQLDIVGPDGVEADEAGRAEILRDMAQTLPDVIPRGTVLARAGESGLAVGFSAANDAGAVATAEALHAFLTAQQWSAEGMRHRIQAAVGLMWANDCLRPESYYDNANTASTRARESNAPVMLFSPEEESSVMALPQWAHELTDILVNNRLSLNCQPVIATGDVTRTQLYYEVLLNLGTSYEKIETRELIDVAERLQRVTEIDRWVTRAVLDWMRAHPDAVAGLGGLSIKLSGQSITNPLFLKFLLGELVKGDLPGGKLIFEISEIDAMDSHAQTQLFMRQLHRHGCRFALGEFGAGYSSFTRLKSMKLEYLKIDRMLVREVTRSMIDEALVRSILETGSFLGIKTVADQVESEASRDKLAEMGVDCMQGALIETPRPLAELEPAAA